MRPEVISMLIRSNIPVLVIAPPGTGRTSFGMSFVNPSVPYLIPHPDLFVMLSVPTLDPVEIGGATYSANNRPVTVAREAFHRAYKRRIEFMRETGQKPPVMFFLDELTNASYEQLAAIQSAISSGYWGGNLFEPPVWIFAAGNPPEISMLAQEAPMPIRTRFLILPWEFKADYEAYLVEKVYHSFEQAVLKELTNIHNGQVIPAQEREWLRLALRSDIKKKDFFQNNELGSAKDYEWQHPKLPSPEVIRHARFWAYGQVRSFLSSHMSILKSAKEKSALDTMEGFPTARTLEIVAEALAVLRAAGEDSPNYIQEVCVGSIGRQAGQALATSIKRNAYPPPETILSWLEKGYVEENLANKDETYIYGLGQYMMHLYNEKIKSYADPQSIMDLNEKQIEVLDKALTVLSPLLKAAPPLRAKMIDLLGSYGIFIEYSIQFLNYTGDLIENKPDQEPAEVFRSALRTSMSKHRLDTNLAAMRLVMKHAHLFSITAQAKKHLKELADETSEFARKIEQMRKEAKTALQR